MGDRVWIHLTCREEDEACFEQLGFVHDTWNTEPAGCVGMTDEEGYLSDELRKTSVKFYGIAGMSHESPEFLFASDGELFIDVPAIDSRPVVRMTKDGGLDEAWLLRATLYHALEEYVRHAFKYMGRER